MPSATSAVITGMPAASTEPNATNSTTSAKAMPTISASRRSCVSSSRTGGPENSTISPVARGASPRSTSAWTSSRSSSRPIPP